MIDSPHTVIPSPAKRGAGPPPLTARKTPARNAPRWGVLLAFLLALTACRTEPGRTADGRTPVRVSLLLISTQQVEYYQWAERTYEARHPDVDVIIEQFPGVSLKDFEIKLRLGFSSGTAPDVFHAHENIIIEFARLGLLDEAPAYIERMVQENSLNERTRRAPYFDGACYGIVSDAVWTALYYNKDMFREAGLDPERPPRTWEEFLDYADRLTVRRPDGSIERTGLSLRKTGFKPGTAEKWLTFLYSAGGQPFNEDGTASAFNSEAGRAALDFYNEVLFERHIDDVTFEGDQQGFGQERVAMFIREIHVVRWLRQNYPDLNFGVAPIPARETSVSAGGSYMFVVNREATDNEQAWRFVEFLLSDEAYGRYMEIGGVMPAIRSIADRPEFRDDPQISVFLEQDVGMPTPFPRVQRTWDILGAYIERFCYGRIGAEEMLRRAQRDIDAVLALNRRSSETP